MSPTPPRRCRRLSCACGARGRRGPARRRAGRRRPRRGCGPAHRLTCTCSSSTRRPPPGTGTGIGWPPARPCSLCVLRPGRCGWREPTTTSPAAKRRRPWPTCRRSLSLPSTIPTCRWCSPTAPRSATSRAPSAPSPPSGAPARRRSPGTCAGASPGASGGCPRRGTRSIASSSSPFARTSRTSPPTPGCSAGWRRAWKATSSRPPRASISRPWMLSTSTVRESPSRRSVSGPGWPGGAPTWPAAIVA